MGEHRIVAILAGGEGRRMGGAKPLRLYGGETLLEHAFDLARSWSDLCVVAVRQIEQAPPALREHAIRDRAGVEGPLGGLASALDLAAARGVARLLTIPCDTPRLPPDLADRLEEALTDGALVAVAASDGQRHPTCALWSVAARGKVDDYLARGRRSLNGFADHCGARVASWTIGPEGDPFANANTPEELAALQPPRA